MAQLDHQPLSLAEWCAGELQRAIFGGKYRPGERLNELALTDEFEISRNTLREAFRLLSHDELVSHEPNRGVFVTLVTARRAHETYTLRRHLELGALHELHMAKLDDQNSPWRPVPIPIPAALHELHRCIDEGQTAASAGDWSAVGTANSNFHIAIVALAGNDLANRFIRALMSRTRLWFLGLNDDRAIHAEYIEKNAQIGSLIAAGEYSQAQLALELYLLHAESNIPRLLS